MQTRNLIALAALVGMMACDYDTPIEPSAGLEAGLPEARAAAASDPDQRASAQLGQLYRLQSAFHQALHEQDLDTLRSLFTEDGVVVAGPNTFAGRDAIAAFFEMTGPYQAGLAGLAPSYTTRFAIHGNTADYGFECIYVAPADDLTGRTILGHRNATGTMRKVGDRWLFETFVAGIGSLP